MNTRTQAINNDTATLADDVRALVAATTNTAEGKITSARNRICAALDRGAKIIEDAQQQAEPVARYTDRAVRDHPYQSIGIATGVAILIGAVVAHLATCGNRLQN